MSDLRWSHHDPRGDSRGGGDEQGQGSAADGGAAIGEEVANCGSVGFGNPFRAAGYVRWTLRMLADEDFPEAERIVPVQDNLHTHGPASLDEAFPPAEAARLKARFEFHFTPKHGSWLNIAELELSALGRGCLARRIPDRPTLAREVCAWQRDRNQSFKRIRWQFTTAHARIKLIKLYP